MVSEYDKEKYDFLLEFVLHEAFVGETVDKTHLLAFSGNDRIIYQCLTLNSS